MSLHSWYVVIFHRPAAWKGSHAPVSPAGKILFASGWTAWLLGVCGIYPLMSAAVFAGCVLALFPLSRRDRKAQELYHGWPQLPAFTERQSWMMLCVVDGVTLSILFFVFVRDRFSPPSTREQVLTHNLGLIMMAIGLVGAIGLYATRPRSE